MRFFRRRTPPIHDDHDIIKRQLNERLQELTEHARRLRLLEIERQIYKPPIAIPIQEK